MAGGELNVKAVVKTLDGVIESRKTAERILISLLKRRNEVEFVLGDGWVLSSRGLGVWSYVPESDADLAYLTELIGGE